MTTDGEERRDRSIGEILALASWDGLSDAEVRTLVDFKVSEAVLGAETRAAQAAAVVQMNELAETARQAKEETVSMLREMVSRGTTLKTVTGNEVEA